MPTRTLFVLQSDSTNLEDFITYCWASLKLVREGVYEVTRLEQTTPLWCVLIF